MAPNKRADNKVMLRVWVEKDRLDLFKKLADSLGLNMSSIINAYILEQTNKYIKDNAKRNSN